MKIRYPIIVLFIIFLIKGNLQYIISPFNPWSQIIEKSGTIIGLGCICLIIYLIIRNIIQAIRKLIARITGRKSREAELKEIEMVRKSNEVLLHLMQDEHRDKDHE